MIDNPDFSPVWNNLGKVEAISVLGIPPGDAQNARDLGMGMPKTRGCPRRCDSPYHLLREKALRTRLNETNTILYFVLSAPDICNRFFYKLRVHDLQTQFLRATWSNNISWRQDRLNSTFTLPHTSHLTTVEYVLSGKRWSSEREAAGFVLGTV